MPAIPIRIKMLPLRMRMCQQRKKGRAWTRGRRGQCCECECHPVIVIVVLVPVLVLQRGCLSPLCIFFARCCKWIRNVTQTTRQRVKREEGRAGERARGRVRRQQSRKSKRRSKKPNRNRTTHTGTKPSETNAQSKDEKTMPKFGTNSKPKDSTRACPGVGLTQLCVIFGQHSSSRSLRTQLSTHSRPPQPRKSGLAL